MRNFLALIVLVLLSPTLHAQDLLELSIDAVSNEKDLESAKTAMVKDVVENTTFKYIKELVGETKFEKQKATINSKIIKQSNRYIPLVRNTPPVQNSTGAFTSTVTMKFSLKDLRLMLLKEGLLHLNEGSPISIPFISIIDRANARSYRWWVDQSSAGFLQDQHDRLVLNLRTQLGKKGFYVVNPVASSLREIMPSAFRGEGFRVEDLLLLGDFYRAEVLIEGKVILDRDQLAATKVTVEIQAIQSSNGRVVAEVTRVFQTKSPPTEGALQKVMTSFLAEAAEEFAGQVLDVWQKGILGASHLKLALKGPVSFQEIEKFKADAMRVSEIKVIRERSFAPQEVIFECEVTGGAGQVAERLKTLKPGGLQWEIQSASTDTIVLRRQ
jgi:hypothetical protein